MRKAFRILLVATVLMALVLQPVSAAGGTDWEDRTPASEAEYDSRLRYLSIISNEVEIVRDVPYCKAKENALLSDNHLLDIYTPADDDHDNRMAIVLLHGGGFGEGHKNEFTKLSTDLAKRGFVVFSMNYRLKANPGEDWNKTLADGANDVKDAIDWIKINSEKYGVDKDHIAIGGGSAGAAAVLEAAYGKSTGIPGSGAFAVLDLYGPVDMILKAGTFNKTSLPALIIHGAQDPVIPIAGDEELIKKLKAAGIYHEFLPLEKSGHGIIEEYMEDAVLNISRFLYRVANGQQNPAYIPETDVINVVSGESFSMKLTRKADGEYLKGSIHTTAPDGWKVKKTTVSDNAKKDNIQLNFKIPDGFGKSSHLVVVDYKLQNNKVNKSIFIVKVQEPLAMTLKPVFNNSNSKVEVSLAIMNPSKTQTQSGNITVSCIESGEKRNMGVNLLAPQKTQSITFPESWKGLLKIEVSTEKGYYDVYESTLPLICVPKVKGKPVIDGKLDDWKDAATFDINKPYQIKLIHDWKGVDDLSAKGYLKWDQEYLYLGVEATDDLYQERTYGSSFNGDSLGVAIDPARGEGPGSKGINVYNIALPKKGNIVCDHWLTPAGLSDEKIKDIVIKREGSKFIYEMAIPWKTALDEGRQLKIGSQLGFCLVVNDNDSGLNRGWMEFGTGINYTMNPNLYGDMFLVE